MKGGRELQMVTAGAGEGLPVAGSSARVPQHLGIFVDRSGRRDLGLGGDIGGARRGPKHGRGPTQLGDGDLVFAAAPRTIDV